MENSRKTQGLIKKLNKIYQRGYVPARAKSDYSELYTKSVNCFGHACFNLSDDDLKELNPYMNELHDFFRDFGSCGIRNYFAKAQERIRSVGLNIERSSLSEHVKKNQWKIAYYIMHDEYFGSDIHFMIQDADGKWTSKVGKNSKIEVYDKLPNTYHENYSLMGIYKITNPYLKLEDENDMTM